MQAKYRYIFKKDLKEWEEKGWEFAGDCFVTGCLGLEECLIEKVEAVKIKLNSLRALNNVARMHEKSIDQKK